MKRIPYRYLIILVLGVITSCDEWIELIPPQGLVREEFWQTKEDVDAVIMGTYESLARLDRTLFLMGELRGDMLIGDVNQSPAEEDIQKSVIYSDNYLCDWSGFYEVVNYANEVIKNAPEVQLRDNTFNDFQLQGYLAEAHFLRSLAYFYLVRIYKDVPFITGPTESDDADFYVAKTDGEEILRQMISDLEEYRQYISNQGFPSLEENKGRATKAAFDALLADINLWLFDYEEVIRHVQKIEANIFYQLTRSSRWFDQFFPGNSIESIFELQYDTERSQNNSLYGLTYYDGKNYDPSPSAIEMFSKEFTAELVRGEENTIAKQGEGDYIVWKYVGRSPDGRSDRTGTERYSANFIIYRLAGVLLMKAEALSQLGRYSEALSIVNDIRDRAGMGSLSIVESATAYEDAILQERALELAYEGKRWFDLLRLGRRNGFARKEVLIQIMVRNVPSTQKRIIATKLTNPLGWYLPIHEQELERNRNLVQNPYYDR